MVWAVQATELVMYYMLPEQYQEMMEQEIEEERRRDQFYGVDPSLPDKLYFQELTAKDSALLQLTNRLQSATEIAEILGDATHPLQLTYLSNEFYSGSRQQKGHDRTWRPRMYIEGSRRAAIVESSFVMSGEEWVPTHVKIESVAKSGETLLDAALPLPHGLKYVNLSSLLSQP